jgi:2-(1,2-epoxy-1,2-dihydrophenyl)acetyl-CoA isomerase
VEHVSMRSGDGLAVLRLKGPDAKNLLVDPLLDELRTALRDVRKSDSRALILTGDGDVFSSGAPHLPEGTALGAEQRARAAGRWVREKLEPTLRAVAELRVPVIAGINGGATGAGLALALMADHRVASDDAVFGVGDRPADVLGSGLPSLLCRTLDRARATTVLLADAPIAAERAQQLGLVDELVAPASVLQRCEAVAAALADRPVWFGPAVRQALDAADELSSAEASRFTSYLVEDATAADH